MNIFLFSSERNRKRAAVNECVERSKRLLVDPFEFGSSDNEVSTCKSQTKEMTKVHLT